MMLLVVLFLGTPFGFFFILYEWLMPFSSLNRFRFFDRKSLRTDADDEDALEYRRFYINRERYTKLRTSFLAMKMDYEPTDKKIDLFSKMLELNLRWRKNYKWIEYAEIDREILENMRQQLHEGSLVVEKYTSAYEGDDRTLPRMTIDIRIAHAFNWLQVMYMPPMLILSVAAYFIWGFELAQLALQYSMIFSWWGFASSENVLRRSKDSSKRRVAHWARNIIIGVHVALYFALLIAIMLLPFIS